MGGAIACNRTGRLGTVPMTVPQPSEVRSGGRSLWARRLGEGPRLVALHGGPGLDHHTLLPLALSLTRLEVWLPDLPGHGESPPRSGKRPGLWETLERLEGWLAELPGGLDFLLGHSLGAWLAQELLRRRRIVPRAAVLLSPLAADQSPDHTAVSRRDETVSLFGRMREIEDPQAQAVAELLAHVEAESAGRAPESFLKAIQGGRLRPTVEYADLLGELHRELDRPARAFDPGCPVLVLGGELDRTTPPDEVEQVASTLTGSQSMILPGSGHYPFADPSAPAARVILRYLREARS